MPILTVRFIVLSIFATQKYKKKFIFATPEPTKRIFLQKTAEKVKNICTSKIFFVSLHTFMRVRARGRRASAKIYRRTTSKNYV